MIRLRRGLVAASYFLGAALIVGATIVLVAYGKGYSYDFQNHRFVLRGLVILSSQPGGGEVSMNGKDLASQTPYRATLESGDYTFTVAKDGYRTWTKTLRVIPSEVTFAQYAILFPETISQTSVKLAPAATKLFPSPNHHRFAYFSGGKSPGVYLFDVGNHQTRLIYSARTGRKPETLSDLTWSSDDSRLLLHSVISRSNHFVALNSSGSAQPTDLTDLFNQNFRQLNFDSGSSQTLYGVNTQGNLLRLSLSDRTVSAVLADGVSAVAFGGGHVFFVKTTTLGQSLFSLERSGLKTVLVQSLAQSPTYEIAYVKHKDKDYLAVLPAKARTATLYQDIFSLHPVSKVIDINVTHLSFSPNGRYLTVFGKDSATYDLEKEERHEFAKPLPAVDSLNWFDEFHLLAMVGGRPLVTEFDGANQTLLNPGLLPGAFAVPDHSAVVGLDQKSGSVIFQQIR